MNDFFEIKTHFLLGIFIGMDAQNFFNLKMDPLDEKNWELLVKSKNLEMVVIDDRNYNIENNIISIIIG